MNRALLHPILLLSMLLLLVMATIAARAAGKSVTIQEMRFDPAEVEVSVGDTVTWTNRDDRDHTVTAADGSFKSGNISAGKRFSHKFTKAGTFAYTCSYHPRMKGTVSVVE